MRVFLLVLLALVARTSTAGATPFADQAAFEAALTGGFALINLDDAPFVGLAVPYNVEDASAAPLFAAAGLDFQGFNAPVFGGQAFQIVVPDRDRLIAYGAGSGGEIVIDLLVPAHGFGAWSNIGDGGRVIAYSGPDMTGQLLGEAPIASGSFGGVVVDQPIGSVHITCEFNFDLRCGALDLQFGLVSSDMDGDGVSDPADNCTVVANPAQTDSDGDGIGNHCDPDIAPSKANDCVVNFSDLLALKTAFFSTPADGAWNPDADLDVNNAINFGDALIMKAVFFGSPGPSGIANDCGVR